MTATDQPTAAALDLDQIEEKLEEISFRVDGAEAMWNPDALTALHSAQALLAEVRRLREQGPERSEPEKRWNTAVDWLLNSSYCCEPSAQAGFQGIAEGWLTPDQATRGWVGDQHSEVTTVAYVGLMETWAACRDADGNLPRTVPVSDPDLDAPDGAVVEGYQRIGSEWIRVDSLPGGKPIDVED